MSWIIKHLFHASREINLLSWSYFLYTNDAVYISLIFTLTIFSYNIQFKKCYRTLLVLFTSHMMSYIFDDIA